MLLSDCSEQYSIELYFESTLKQLIITTDLSTMFRDLPQGMFSLLFKFLLEMLFQFGYIMEWLITFEAS